MCSGEVVRADVLAMEVAWLLQVKGVAFQLVFTRPPRTVSPEFLALNPNAMVPVLQDDDFSLYESYGTDAVVVVCLRDVRARC
jgi:glutathione S-transferase